MPLSEISRNSIGRNGKIPDSPTTSILNAYTGNQSDIETAPSSIHSMLRNTTETGDIGLFSIKPTRAPYPISYASPRTSGFSSAVDGLPQHQLRQLYGRGSHRERQTGNGRLNSLQSYHGTSTSSIISMYQSESQKSFQPRVGRYRNNDQRTFSMSQTSLVSYSLSNHRSYGNLRPRSPFAYPTRLKRPGYRPSSPALTDLNGTDVRTRFGLDRGSNFRTPSPLSIDAGRGGFAACYPIAMNKSMPSLQHHPSNFADSRNRGFRAPKVQLRPYLPRPPSSQSFRFQSQGLQRRPSQGSTWSGLQSPSPTLTYYDYSEAFESTDHCHNPSLAAEPSSEQLSTPVGLVGTQQELMIIKSEIETAVDPAIEANLNVPAKDALPVVESPSPIVAPNRFLRQMSEWEKEHGDPSTGNDDGQGVQIDDKIKLDEQERAGKMQIMGRGSPSQETVGHHILSSSRPQARERLFRASRRTTADSRNPHTTSLPKCSVDENSKSLVHAAIAPVIPQRLQSITPVGEGRSSLASWAIPSLDLGLTDFVPEQAPPDLQLITSAAADHVSIQAPKPERSASSRTQRDRFSRILSIDEGFAELARAVVDSGLESNVETLSVPLEGINFNNKLGAPPADNLSQSRHSKNILNILKVAEESTEEVDELGSLLDFPRRTSLSSHELSSTATRNGVPRIDSATYPELQGGGTMSLHKRDISKSEPVMSSETLKLSSALSTAVLQTDLENGGSHKVSNTSSMQGASYPPGGQAEPTQSINLPTESKEEARTMALLEAANIVPWEYDEPSVEDAFPITKYRLWTPLERKSHTFLSSSRSADEDIRKHNHHPSNSRSRVPKFKLKIIRASSSSIGTVRVTKRSSSPISSPKNKPGSPVNAFHTGSPRQGSTSKKVLDQRNAPRKSPLHAHQDSITNSIPTTIPRINLRPPSSSLHFNEVRSFFSDDSSHMELRTSSLRQRLSHFKAIAIRGTSTDDLRSMERGQAGSALGLGRASAVGSYTTEGISGMTTIKQRKWKISQKLKGWWHRGEEKLRDLSKKVKGRSRKKRSATAELYAGV